MDRQADTHLLQLQLPLTWLSGGQHVAHYRLYARRRESWGLWIPPAFRVAGVCTVGAPSKGCFKRGYRIM